MYKIIEAHLENGKLTGPDVDKLPDEGHVLVTLVSGNTYRKRPVFGTITAEHVEISDDAFSALSDGELTDWGL